MPSWSTARRLRRARSAASAAARDRASACTDARRRPDRARRGGSQARSPWPMIPAIATLAQARHAPCPRNQPPDASNPRLHIDRDPRRRAGASCTAPISPASSGWFPDRAQLDIHPFRLEQDRGAPHRQLADAAGHQAAAQHDAFGAFPRLRAAGSGARRWPARRRIPRRRCGPARRRPDRRCPSSCRAWPC